jgi:hypothetical protein
VIASSAVNQAELQTLVLHTIDGIDVCAVRHVRATVFEKFVSHPMVVLCSKVSDQVTLDLRVPDWVMLDTCKVSDTLGKPGRTSSRTILESDIAWT